MQRQDGGELSGTHRRRHPIVKLELLRPQTDAGIRQGALFRWKFIPYDQIVVADSIEAGVIVRGRGGEWIQIDRGSSSGRRELMQMLKSRCAGLE